MSDTYLIIPDIHLKYSRVDKIVNSEGHDKVLVMGDLFHDFHDTVDQNKKMAEWTKERLSDKKWIFIFGNHDCSHAYNNYLARCSGWEEDKQIAVDLVLKDEDWDKFVWYYWLDNDSLVSHAGLTNPLAKKILHKKPKLENVKSLLEQEALKATKALKNRQSHWFFRAGRSRGGGQDFGGLNWCDWSEFEPIEGINQLVAHTPDRRIRWKQNDVCIDTHLNHYGLWRDGRLTVKEYVDL